MKRLLISLALITLALSAFGQSADRDVLLTADGTLYSVESLFAKGDEANVHSNRYLSLTVQNGKDSHTQVVPASANGGSHLEPSLTYDSETKTLFIFWEAAREGALATDLAFVWYRDGVWGKAAMLDGADWDLRSNLRIALTHKTTTPPAKDGSATSIPEITVHAVWWEQGPAVEWARYAMITVDHGDVTVDKVQNLTDFVSAGDPFLVTPSANEVLRHPAIFESPNHDVVDVVFGDPRTDKMHRVAIQPVAQGGRIRVPIGRSHDLPTPTAAINSTSSVTAISTGSDNIAYYFSTGDSVKYLLYKNGQWSDVRSISLNDHFTSDAAVNALRKMMSSD
jgi:hypothetical protein